MAVLKNTIINEQFIKVSVGNTAQRPSSPENGSLRYNIETDKTEWYKNVWIDTNQCAPLLGSGGSSNDITVNSINYRVHIFSTVGTSTFTVTQGGEVEYLIVAGGGAGGRHHGSGGGGGGVIEGKTKLTAETHNIVVGAGGTPTPGSSGSPEGNAGNGGNSSAFQLTAIGGGGGGNYSSGPGANGGSGGGSQNWVQLLQRPGQGVPGQGFPGKESATQGNVNSEDEGGGGGGAGEPGGKGWRRRGGGDGKPSSIAGSIQFFGGGGGAGNYRDTTGPGFVRPLGGLGGGGRGNLGPHGSGDVALSGTANTGGGGGGSATFQGPAGAGGSGVVIVRYRI